MLMWDSQTKVCSSVYVAAKLIKFYAHLIQFTTFISFLKNNKKILNQGLKATNC